MIWLLAWPISWFLIAAYTTAKDGYVDEELVVISVVFGPFIVAVCAPVAVGEWVGKKFR
jgi:hypothetical protein